MASPDEPRLHRIEETLARIEYAIVGNGEPGLNERVRSIEKWVQASEENARTLRRLVLGVLVVGVAAAAVFLIRSMG